MFGPTLQSNDMTDLEGCSVLVLEDEALIAYSIKEQLTRRFGAHVTTAASLRKAKAQIDAEHFDAAILDVRLPDGTSENLARDLIGRGVRVVFHSGHADESLLEACPKAAFVGKPAMIRELAQALTTLLSGRRVEQSAPPSSA